MSDKLTVPIGPNATLDGGPFNNFEADGIDGETEDGLLVGVDGSEFTIDQVEDALASEMEDHEPMYLTTGDVGAGYTVGSIDLPLVEGYRVEVHNLSHDWSPLPDLRDITRRRSIETKLNRLGGVVEG